MEWLDRIIAALDSLVQSGQSGSIKRITLEQRHQTVSTPAVRKLARQFSKEFSALPWTEKTCIVQGLLEYGTNRAAHLGVFLLGLSIHDASFVDTVALDSMVEAFRGWSVTDAFCIEVMQPLLERFTSDVLSLTVDWAAAESCWKRRASVVVFVRKIGASGCYTQHGLDACERLLFDPEDLVRKGVGWALKDLMRGDRETVLAYVETLRKRRIPSVITLYALRDTKGPERERILAIKP
jgi:3-methyladenine DNA glycosylase AlkD